MTGHFFGYGSLVNRATHDYPGAHPARLHGWRRIWVQTPARDQAYLSIHPAPDTVIDGLVAQVPGGNWSSLDAREAAYKRHQVRADPVGRNRLNVQVYAVQGGKPATLGKTILLSYLDTVIQGFLREFGTEGAARFFATTDGWDAQILNDRAAPCYPRAQNLSAAERGCVDAALETLGHRI